MKTNSFFRTILTALTTLCFVSAIGAQSKSVQDHVAALKQSLEENRKQLQGYEWLETTVVLVNGEEKSTKEYTARYAADGTIQKTLAEASPEKKMGGLRGHIEEKKKEEMTAYMKRAVELVRFYVPPSSEKIQAVAKAGGVSVDLVEPGRRVRLNFRNYKMQGDTLAIDMDPSTHKLLAATVSTYLDDPKDAITLDIQFGSLPDGTTYPASVNLNAEEKHLTVKVTNTDYRRIS